MILERIYTPPAGKGRVRASVYIRLPRSKYYVRGYGTVRESTDKIIDQSRLEVYAQSYIHIMGDYITKHNPKEVLPS